MWNTSIVPLFCPLRSFNSKNLRATSNLTFKQILKQQIIILKLNAKKIETMMKQKRKNYTLETTRFN